MKPMFSLAAALLLSALAGTALAQALQPPAATPAASTAPKIAEQPASSRPLPPDVVVAQGDIELTLTDIDARMSRIPAESRANFINDPERIETLLRNMLLTKQMAREAEATGAQNDPVVAADIAYAREEVLFRRRNAMLVKEVKFPDFETLAKERYIASPEQYRSPERITLRHLLVARHIHGDAVARQKAEDLRKEFLEKGGDFAEFVKAHTDDKVAEDAAPGAEIGLVKNLSRGQTDSDFETAAFALAKEGDVSEVVRTRYGYHIIRLEKREPSQRFEYEKVKPRIIEELRNEFIARTRQEFIDKQRNKAIDANPDLVQSLRTRYLPDGAGAKAIGNFDAAEPAADLAPKGKDAAVPAPGH